MVEVSVKKRLERTQLQLLTMTRLPVKITNEERVQILTKRVDLGRAAEKQLKKLERKRKREDEEATANGAVGVQRMSNVVSAQTEMTMNALNMIFE